MKPASSLRTRESEGQGQRARREGEEEGGREGEREDARVPARAVEVVKVRLLHLGDGRVLAVPPAREDAHLALDALVDVLGPHAVHGRDEHGARREHDGRVVGPVRVVERDEVVDDEVHERVAALGEHEVVRDADRDRRREDHVKVQERVEVAPAPDVEVHVDAAKVVQDKVPDDVGPLDRVRVAVERREEPRVVLGDEGARGGVRPQLELAASRVHTSQHLERGVQGRGRERAGRTSPGEGRCSPGGPRPSGRAPCRSSTSRG